MNEMVDGLTHIGDTWMELSVDESRNRSRAQYRMYKVVGAQYPVTIRVPGPGSIAKAFRQVPDLMCAAGLMFEVKHGAPRFETVRESSN